MSSLNYTLRNNHAISLRSYWISYRNESGTTQNTSFLLSYAIPFGIPVRKKKSIGGIQGTVSDAEGKPLEKIVIEVGGLTAITDKAGEFTSPGFKPGTYYVAVEQGSIGLGRITTEKAPFPVAVRGGERLHGFPSASRHHAGGPVVCPCANRTAPGKLEQRRNRIRPGNFS